MHITAHPTKSGPGRKHGQGVAHGCLPKAAKGAPFGFVQRLNPNKPMSRRDKHRVNVRLAGEVTRNFA